MKKRRYFRYFLVILVLIFSGSCCGCVKKLNIHGKRQKVEYTICKDSNLPEQLKVLLEKKKKKAETFTYRNSMYLYLVVCYGQKKYSGYSVKVEECSQSEDTLFLRTQLIGPSAGEPVMETLNYPYIVLRCRQMDVFCVIDS